jgi:hypothetical protein
MLVRLWFLLKIVALLTGDIEVMAFRGGELLRVTGGNWTDRSAGLTRNRLESRGGCRLITFRNRGYRGLEILFERKGIIGEI